MVPILRYFTEFGTFGGALRKSGWQRHNYGQFMTARRPRRNF